MFINILAQIVKSAFSLVHDERAEDNLPSARTCHLCMDACMHAELKEGFLPWARDCQRVGVTPRKRVRRVYSKHAHFLPAQQYTGCVQHARHTHFLVVHLPVWDGKPPPWCWSRIPGARCETSFESVKKVFWCVRLHLRVLKRVVWCVRLDLRVLKRVVWCVRLH